MILIKQKSNGVERRFAKIQFPEGYRLFNYPDLHSESNIDDMAWVPFVKYFDFSDHTWKELDIVMRNNSFYNSLLLAVPI